MKPKIISDGVGLPKLIDEDSGEMIHLIQKITWRVSTEDIFLSRTNIEIINVPIEITTKATIYLQRLSETGKFEDAEKIEKRIRIVSSTITPEKPGRIQDICIYDVETNEPMPGVLEAKFEIDTSNEVIATLKQFQLGKKSDPTPPVVEERVASIDTIDVREFGDVFTDIFATGKSASP